MASVAGRYDALFFDLDGVVYRGDDAVPNAAEVLSSLRRAGAPILYLTNNSARTREQVAARLARLGIPALPEEIMTSALATAATLRHRYPQARTAFLIGERGVAEALASAGITVLDNEPAHADLVVVGWDRGLTYDKLRTAALLARRGASLIATNADATYPAPDGLWPGAGSILAAVTTASGVAPTVVGKPHRPLFEAAAEATGARHPLVVGDRLDTDIAGAAGMGWDSLLVLTGAAALPDLLLFDPHPTYVGPDLTILLDHVPPARFRGAGAQDVAGIEVLLEEAGLSCAGVSGRLSDTFVSSHRPELPAQGHEVIHATICVEDVGGIGLVRSLAVRDEHRGRGLGSLAVAAAASRARAHGLSQLALFTEAAAPFFAALGFSATERDALPAAVRSSRQAQEECAATATPMVTSIVPAQNQPGS